MMFKQRYWCLCGAGKTMVVFKRGFGKGSLSVYKCTVCGKEIVGHKAVVKTQ